MLRSLVFPLACTLVACSSSSDPDWQYGAADVDAALTGTWSGTWSAGGKTGSIELQLARTPPTATPKCGSRTLSSEIAPKCMEMTTVMLSGTLTTSDGTFTAAPMTGTMSIVGTAFSSGFIELRTADGKTLTTTYVSPTLKDGRVKLVGGDATFTLSRPMR